MKRKVLSLITLAALVLLLAVSAVALTAEEWFDKGDNYMDTGDWEKAIECFTKAISLDPEFALAYAYRGLAYSIELGKYDLAIADQSSAIELDPKYVYAYCWRGDAYYDLGKYDLAIADYTKAISLDPKDTNTYNSRGFAYEKLGNYDLAIADYRYACDNGEWTACNNLKRLTGGQ